MIEIKRVMISQPMSGKTDDEILNVRNKSVDCLKSMGHDVVDSFFRGEDGYYSLEALEDMGVVNVPLFYLAKSLEYMSKCDAVYFCDGWEDYRGCLIEHNAAKLYGLDVIYESER